MSRGTNRSFELTCCMSEANNFHSVIYSGHYHRSLLVNELLPCNWLIKKDKKCCTCLHV